MALHSHATSNRYNKKVFTEMVQEYHGRGYMNLILIHIQKNL